jgi:hypothetical protein
MMAEVIRNNTIPPCIRRQNADVLGRDIVKGDIVAVSVNYREIKIGVVCSASEDEVSVKYDIGGILNEYREYHSSPFVVIDVNTFNPTDQERKILELQHKISGKEKLQNIVDWMEHPDDCQICWEYSRIGMKTCIDYDEEDEDKSEKKTEYYNDHKKHLDRFFEETVKKWMEEND